MSYSTGEAICESSQPHKIVLGRGETLQPLEKAILGMKVGERSKITIKHSSI
jgi:FKBP-type peptidyl-prolyl cis-trans isomerase 2